MSQYQGFLGKFVKRPQILIDDPLFHEFLEGIRRYPARQIIRGESGSKIREQRQLRQNHLSSRYCTYFGIVFHEDGENGCPICACRAHRFES